MISSSLMIPLAMIVAALICCCCCCIPCIKGLNASLIDTALTRTMYQNLQNRIEEAYDDIFNVAGDVYEEVHVRIQRF